MGPGVWALPPALPGPGLCVVPAPLPLLGERLSTFLVSHMSAGSRFHPGQRRAQVLPLSDSATSKSHGELGKETAPPRHTDPRATPWTPPWVKTLNSSLGNLGAEEKHKASVPFSWNAIQSLSCVARSPRRTERTPGTAPRRGPTREPRLSPPGPASPWRCSRPAPSPAPSSADLGPRRQHRHPVAAAASAARGAGGASIPSSRDETPIWGGLGQSGDFHQGPLLLSNRNPLKRDYSLGPDSLQITETQTRIG